MANPTPVGVTMQQFNLLKYKHKPLMHMALGFDPSDGAVRR